MKSVVAVDGHIFTPYGNEEMLCRTCGYVIWPVESVLDARKAMATIDGTPYALGKIR